MRVAPAYRSVELRLLLIREKHLLHLDRRLKYRITIQHNHGLDNDEGRLRRHVQLVVHRDKVAHVSPAIARLDELLTQLSAHVVGVSSTLALVLDVLI